MWQIRYENMHIDIFPNIKFATYDTVIICSLISHIKDAIFC